MSRFLRALRSELTWRDLLAFALVAALVVAAFAVVHVQTCPCVVVLPR